MTAIMAVAMDILDDGGMAAYFAAVPGILREYGALQIAGSRDVRRIEGVSPPPPRVMVFAFPSLAAIDAFMADERYRPFRLMREQGAKSDILVFENAAEITKGMTKPGIQ